jgi:hypothetical protein
MPDPRAEYTKGDRGGLQKALAEDAARLSERLDAAVARWQRLIGERARNTSAHLPPPTLAHLEEELAAVMADSSALRTQAEEESRVARNWESKAVYAVRSERDDLAKTALVRRAEHEDNARRLFDESEALEQIGRELSQAIERLRERTRI